ncbi:hypothetical protein [Actinophytocola sp. NPDC049390]|uniref:hypothetical protein n=1 Tax=Actinophytocola sp. NPDC049390 TaxID=3363894 RepID=UPI0037A95486
MISPTVVTARWLLLCVLAFGLIGMHHLGWMSHPCGTPAEPMSSTSVLMPDDVMAPAAPSAGQPDPSAGHRTHHGVDDLLHLCLAVLVAALALVGLWAHARRSAGNLADEQPPPLASWRQPPHPPPVPAPPLTALGVLRL